MYNTTEFFLHMYNLGSTEAGVRVQDPPSFCTPGADNIKSLAQRPNSCCGAEPGLEPSVFWLIAQSSTNLTSLQLAHR